MAGLMTGISANLAYAKHGKKKEKKADYEGALRFLTSVSPETVKAGMTAAKKKQDDDKKKKEEEEKRRKKATFGGGGFVGAHNIDKTLRQIQK